MRGRVTKGATLNSMDLRSASLIHRNVIRSSKGNIYCANIGLEIHCQLKLGHKLFSRNI